MTVSLPLPFIDRFALIISSLHAAVAARIRCPPVTAEIIVFICARLRRIAAAFATLAGQIRAGKYVARPAGCRRAGGAGSRRGVSVVMLHYNLGLPPWAPGWLHRIAPGDAGVWMGALRSLLTEPDFAAVVYAVPRMRRILRPLCFMLGIEASLLAPHGAVAEPVIAKAEVAPAAGGGVSVACVPVVAGSAPVVAGRGDAEPVGVIFETA